MLRFRGKICYNVGGGCVESSKIRRKIDSVAFKSQTAREEERGCQAAVPRGTAPLPAASRTVGAPNERRVGKPLETMGRKARRCRAAMTALCTTGCNQANQWKHWGAKPEATALSWPHSANRWSNTHPTALCSFGYRILCVRFMQRKEDMCT